MSSPSTLKERFERECGARFFLDPSDLTSLDSHLRKLGWIENDRVRSAARIGDGNMNLTVRVRLERRTAILKQARPWVEKYPHIAAPVSRAGVEAAFYSVAAQHPAVNRHMPGLLGGDPESYLLFLEDLGHSADLTSLYTGAGLSTTEGEELIGYLNALHAAGIPPELRNTFANRAMRALNHAHQYDIPLKAENGLDLDRITPGLSRAVAEVKSNPAYCAAVAGLGSRYLEDGGTLLHGDFFPGSWLRTPAGIKIIDPEFCFLGCAEYDLGILHAHLLMTHHDNLWPALRACYNGPADWTLAGRFAGAELMRRLIGVAQLPLHATLEQKRQWLELSRKFVCG